MESASPEETSLKFDLVADQGRLLILIDFDEPRTPTSSGPTPTIRPLWSLRSTTPPPSSTATPYDLRALQADERQRGRYEHGVTKFVVGTVCDSDVAKRIMNEVVQDTTVLLVLEMSINGTEGQLRLRQGRRRHATAGR